jgi:hypothetical protein
MVEPMYDALRKDDCAFDYDDDTKFCGCLRVTVKRNIDTDLQSEKPKARPCRDIENARRSLRPEVDIKDGSTILTRKDIRLLFKAYTQTAIKIDCDVYMLTFFYASDARKALSERKKGITKGGFMITVDTF